jgi:hypothetical protein
MHIIPRHPHLWPRKDSFVKVLVDDLRLYIYRHVSHQHWCCRFLDSSRGWFFSNIEKLFSTDTDALSFEVNNPQPTNYRQ